MKAFADLSEFSGMSQSLSHAMDFPHDIVNGIRRQSTYFDVDMKYNVGIRNIHLVFLANLIRGQTVLWQVNP